MFCKSANGYVQLVTICQVLMLKRRKESALRDPLVDISDEVGTGR